MWNLILVWITTEYFTGTPFNGLASYRGHIDQGTIPDCSMCE